MEPNNRLTITYKFSQGDSTENSQPTETTQQTITHPLIKDFINSDLLSISEEILQLSKIKIIKDVYLSKTSAVAREIWKIFSNDIPTSAEKDLKTELKKTLNSPTLLKKIENISHKNLFIIAKAFDHIFCYEEIIFEKIVKIIVNKKISLSLEDVGEFTFAFSRGRFPGELAIFHQMQKFVLTNKHNLTWTLLGNILTGFVRKYKNDFIDYDAKFMIDIYDSAKNKNHKLQPSAEDLTHIVDAYAKMYLLVSDKRWRGPKEIFKNKIAEIFHDLCPYILRADDLDVHQMVKIVEGYRDVDYGYPHEIFKNLFDKIIGDLDSLIISKLGLFTRVCFEVGYSQSENLLKLSHKVLENKLKFSNERLVTTIYEILIGFCASNDYAKIIKAFLQHIFEIENQDSQNKRLWIKDDLSQIHTIYHFYLLKSKDDSLKLPSSLEEKIQNYLASLHRPEMSRLHKDVYRHLPTHKGYTNEFQFYSFFLDIVNKEEKIVIEVDGECHFYRNIPHTFKTTNRIKEELLKAEGWKLIRIPYFEWNHFEQTFRNDKLKQALEKKSYLAKKLEQL